MTLIFKFIPCTQLVKATQNGRSKTFIFIDWTKINAYVISMDNKKQTDNV